MSVNFGLDDVKGIVIGDIDFKVKLIAPNGKLACVGYKKGRTDMECYNDFIEELKDGVRKDAFNAIYGVGTGKWELRVYDV